MLDVVTIGGATVDLFIRTDTSKIISIKEKEFQKEYLAFEYGGKIYLEDVFYSPGGGGNNTAVALARLGLSVAFIGCIGQDDEGRRLLMSLKSEGVRTDFVQRLTDEHTGLSIILTSFEGDRTAFSFRGANNRLTEEVIRWDELRETKWLYIPSLSGESQEILSRLVSFAQEHDIKIGCNPGNEQLRLGMDGLQYLWEGCEVLVLNKEEAEQLTGLRARHRTVDENSCPVEVMRGEPWISDVRQIMKVLFDRGIKTVVITEGIKGAQAFDGQNFYWMPVYPYEPLDTLGAGDAFASSFIAGTILGKTTADSLRIAAANASLVVRQFGAQPGLGSWKDVDQVIKQHANYTVISETS